MLLGLELLASLAVLLAPGSQSWNRWLLAWPWLLQVPGIAISINPDKPRKGCFEIRSADGTATFVSLLVS